MRLLTWFTGVIAAKFIRLCKIPVQTVDSVHTVVGRE